MADDERLKVWEVLFRRALVLIDDARKLGLPVDFSLLEILDYHRSFDECGLIPGGRRDHPTQTQDAGPEECFALHISPSR
jgi:hypothetical protein